jgi:hypothetical protein
MKLHTRSFLRQLILSGTESLFKNRSVAHPQIPDRAGLTHAATSPHRAGARTDIKDSAGMTAVQALRQGSKPSSSTGRRLGETKRLLAALEKLVSPEAIGPWLKDPNPAFDGSTPLQVIERGETDRIWRMVYELESGEPA